jgi:metallophosphoesterase superfamily enzyme
MNARDVERLRALTTSVDWIWIAGNHDPAPPDDLGGRRLPEWTHGALVFRHEADPAASAGEVSGHYHPVARVLGRGASLRARCFATDGVRLIMPAYGALAGGLNVLDATIQALFPGGCEAAVLGPDGVYRAPAHRLAPDARSVVWKPTTSTGGR